MTKNDSKYLIHIETASFGDGQTEIRCAGNVINFKFEYMDRSYLKKDEYEVVSPSPSQWQDFWGTLQTLPNWKMRYSASGVCDGMGWQVDLHGPGVCLSSSGYHETPPGWNKLRKALEKLLGQKEFLF